MAVHRWWRDAGVACTQPTSVGALLICTLAVLTTFHHAHAGVGIERYDRARPADAGPVIQKFEHYTMKYGTAITGERLWRGLLRFPAVQDESITTRMIAEKLDEAHRKWRRTDNAGAKLDVEQALAWSHDNPGTSIRITSWPELVTRAYVTLAMIATDAKDKAGARGWMIRLKTEIPDHAAIRTKFGEDAEKLYNEALKTGRALERGKLIVRASSPSARIFINEVHRGNEGVFQGELPIGEYRIVVDDAGSMYRFDRTVVANDATELKVDLAFHRVLVASREWVGVIVPPELQVREDQILGEVSFWIQSTTYFVLSVRKDQTHRYLTGTVFTQGRGKGRAGEIVLGDAQEDARMEAFAAFLEKGASSPLISTAIGASKTSVATRVRTLTPATGTRRPVPPYSVAAWIVGAGLLAFGGALVYGHVEDSTCLAPCDMRYGIPMAVVGLGLYVSGFYVAHRRTQRAKRSAFVAPARGGALAGIGWSF